MDPHYDGDKPAKRNLPSWMGSKENANKSHGKKRASDSHESTGGIAHTGETVSIETTHKRLPFSKLLEGVVFALSGFVNPERSTLRSQALEMGAEYRPDWSSDCTLLVCAFPNTPKFRQVESDCGTIVSKEWISECYNHKKLVDIDCYLMHAGRPWRKNSKHYEAQQDESNAQSVQPREQVERKSRAKPSESAMSKVGHSNDVKDHFSPSKVEEWATNDLNETIMWLESQEEKPEPDEVRMIAVEGIITCLKDAIESLRQNQDIRHVTEQWMFVPHVVKELAELEGGNRKGLISKKELCELAVTCKMVYESKFGNLNSSLVKSKKQKTGSAEEVNKRTKATLEDEASDSDRTIEMTEEEIEIACKELSSELSSWL